MIGAMKLSQDLSVGGQTSSSAQYVTFMCAGEEYGVDILRVQEIKRWSGVTRVPHSPPHVLGVMNLRGMIVPLIDLRLRFNIEKRLFDASTAVIVVHVRARRGEKTVGIVVDAVSEVYTFQNDSIRPTPEIGSSPIDSACISGIVAVGEKNVMLLNIDMLMADSVDGLESSQGAN